MDSMENITLRKQQRTSSLNNLATMNNSSTFFDATIQSSPNTSITEGDQSIRRVIEKNLLLEEKLQSAYQTIENLNINNARLTAELENVKLLLEQEKMFQTAGSNRAAIDSIKMSCVETKTSKNSEMHRIDLTPNQIPSCYTQNITQHKTEEDSQYGSKQTVNSNSTAVSQNKKTLRKMCIVSSNNVNKMLEIAEHTFVGYKLCHYITPNGGIIQLFADLDKKLLNFTFEDYCVIYIGERDFESSNNYRFLLNFIKNKLKNINHTNVVICSPNFKLSNVCGIFNNRIEIFNHLMYTDLELNSYAYLFDSNYSIKYTHEMFSKYNSKINNGGLARILKNLMYYINYLNHTTPSNSSFSKSQELNYLNTQNVVKQIKFSDQGSQTDPIGNDTRSDLFRV